MLNARCKGYSSGCCHKNPNAASNPVLQDGLPSVSLSHCSKYCSWFLPCFCFRQSESSVLESDMSSKAASTPCQDHGVNTGSGKLQTLEHVHGTPDCHIQSTSTLQKLLYRMLLLARATDAKQRWDRYHFWATFTLGLLQNESEGHSFHQILSGMKALVCAYFETMSEGSAQAGRRENKAVENVATILNFPVFRIITKNNSEKLI